MQSVIRFGHKGTRSGLEKGGDLAREVGRESVRIEETEGEEESEQRARIEQDPKKNHI